jgi:hypothetical protein
VAFAHGKSAVFKLDNSSGSLVDYSAYLNDWGSAETLRQQKQQPLVLLVQQKPTSLVCRTLQSAFSGLFDATADGTLAGTLGTISNTFV